MLNTLVWIIYDIADDKIRGRVAKECKKAGLTRVQKSVFLGRLEWNRFDELAEKFEEIIVKKTDSVYVFPFCQEDFKKIRVLGQGFDKKYVNDEILAKFF
jgi:CRISPR-associated protein Cas2